MNKRIVGSVLSTLILFLILNIGLSEPLAVFEASSSSDETVVYVDPQASNIALGSTFTINISIANVVDVFSYEFKVYYNNTLLHGVQVKLPKGHILEPVGVAYLFVIELEIIDDFNSTHGCAKVGATLLNPEPGRSGSGVLATITFQATNVGSCNFDLCETILVDSAAKQFANEVQIGHFECNAAKHETAVLLEVPSHLVPKETTLIKASIQNWGQNDETNLVLQLLIDGTIVDSIPVSFLAAGSSQSLSRSWSSPTEATHNVTAYAPPVVGEEDILNNVKSTEVLLSYAIYVPLHFPTIQEAIQTASSGDTIHVAPGTYQEDLTIDKPVTLAGENSNTTVIVGKVLKVVEILKAGCGSRISGFTIQMGAVGIHVESDNNLIEDNTITDCDAGICLWKYASNNTIRRNTIINSQCGIYSEFGGDNAIYHNNFINNTSQAVDQGTNTWNQNGEGNYWSDYNGTDTNQDNVGDTPYNVNITTGTWDNAPLTYMFILLSGDLSEDGKVNIADLSTVAASFGSYPKHPRWNPATDINSDGKVDILDMVLIAKNFGKTR